VTAPHAEIDAAIRASSVLHLLPERSRARLAAAGSAIELKAGTVLFQAGDPGDAAYVVLSGEIEVRQVSAGGRDLRHTALGPGALVGEMAALDGGARSTDVVAARRTRLWRIPARALLEVLEADPPTAVALMAEFSRRLRVANAELQAATSLDLAGRVARLLVTERGPKDLVVLTQTEMARRIGASREKVNRKLHAWAAEGWVEVEPAGVRLLDLPRLKALFGG
jgi:CRP-like cAMP-binding protein